VPKWLLPNTKYLPHLYQHGIEKGIYKDINESPLIYLKIKAFEFITSIIYTHIQKVNFNSMAPSSSFVHIMIVLSLVFVLSGIVPKSEARRRAFFVFGDSLVDNGNNNYLLTTARADSPPYGIDYPTRKPTGRFSNGFNIPDLIS